MSPISGVTWPDTLPTGALVRGPQSPIDARSDTERGQTAAPRRTRPPPRRSSHGRAQDGPGRDVDRRVDVIGCVAMSRATEDTNRRMLRARDAMDRAYAEPLDIAALASIAAVSEAHFIRAFRSVFGETPHRYLQ